MEGNRQSPGHALCERLIRATAKILQLFKHALIPPDRPVAQTSDVPELPADDLVLKGRKQSFSRELFAELLIELPTHRRRISQAYQAGDYYQLRNTVHQLLGAVAYCDAPELETGLRELRLAITTDNKDTIAVYYERAINVLDSTLRYSGYRAGK